MPAAPVVTAHSGAEGPPDAAGAAAFSQWVLSLFPTLPERWWKGLTPEQIRRTIRVESIPNGKVIERLASPTRTAGGYVVLQLGRGHPYARENGQQYLHRYIMQRHLRRRLEPWEHVHHVNHDHPPRLESTDPADMRVMFDTDHGHYHYYWHEGCSCEDYSDAPPLDAGRQPMAGEPF